jgi:antitoxin (DNA-binding transcriptional repressor) of toxin-antitoxin stability system
MRVDGTATVDIGAYRFVASWGFDRGESFIVTRNGNPVGGLHPIKRRRFVPKDEVLAAFSGVGHIDYRQFRADIDRYVDQDPHAACPSRLPRIPRTDSRHCGAGRAARLSR